MLSDSADTFVISLEKAEADLKAVAHRLEEGFAQQCGRHQVRQINTCVDCQASCFDIMPKLSQVNLFHLAQRIRRLERYMYSGGFTFVQALSKTAQQLLAAGSCQSSNRSAAWS